MVRQTAHVDWPACPRYFALLSRRGSRITGCFVNYGRCLIGAAVVDGQPRATGSSYQFFASPPTPFGLVHPLMRPCPGSAFMSNNDYNRVSHFLLTGAISWPIRNIRSLTACARP